VGINVDIAYLVGIGCLDRNAHHNYNCLNVGICQGILNIIISVVYKPSSEGQNLKLHFALKFLLWEKTKNPLFTTNDSI